MSRGILVLITENSTNILGLFWKCFRHNFTPDNAGVLGIDIKTAVNSNAAAEYLAGFAAGHLSQAQLCLAILITSEFQMISRTKAIGREYRQKNG